jgi:flavin-dependent dehydrogenase
VEGKPRGSVKTILRARVVVGADGLHSTVARAAGARSYQEHPALTGVMYSYWSGLSHLGASFHARPDRLVLVWPTNDDLTCIYAAWPLEYFPQVRKNVEPEFLAALDLVPGLREALASGHREHRFVGTDDLPNLYRTSAGPGWALAGDAGHHKDPSTGMGMSDAFASAELLAEAIHGGLVGQLPLEAALSSYQKKRDALTANGFALTLSTARLAPLTPRLEAFYRAAADQPDVISRIFGVIGGSLPIGELLEDGAYPAS